MVWKGNGRRERPATDMCWGTGPHLQQETTAEDKGSSPCWHVDVDVVDAGDAGAGAGADADAAVFADAAKAVFANLPQ
jgi:hypothetical protein